MVSVICMHQVEEEDDDDDPIETPMVNETQFVPYKGLDKLTNEPDVLESKIDNIDVAFNDYNAENVSEKCPEDDDEEYGYYETMNLQKLLDVSERKQREKERLSDKIVDLQDEYKQDTADYANLRKMRYFAKRKFGKFNV
jgi:hypothetical protein